jgi:enoyl-CoA hydratase/carnithine racemase
MVRMEQDGGVARVVLDRAAKRNALTPDMVDALEAAVAGLGSVPASRRMEIAGSAPRGAAVPEGAGSVEPSTLPRVCVISGEGPAFCAGFDLELCAHSANALPRLLEGLARILVFLRALPIPVVAAVQGGAIGGGCALLGGADIVVIDADAKIGYPVVRLGVSPAVSAPTLRLAIGDGPTRQRLLDPALIDGRQAEQLGLAHEVVEGADEVLPRAMEIARGLANLPEPGVRATRALLGELDARGMIGGPLAGLHASLRVAGGAEERSRLEAMFPPAHDAQG